MWCLVLFFFFGPWQVAALSIRGTGSIVPTQAYSEAAFAYDYAQTSTHVTYTGTGTGAGKCRMSDVPASDCTPADRDLVDFGAMAATLKSDDYNRNPDLQLYPTLAYAIVPIYYLGPNITGLVLTPSALAQIFSGQITAWDDPRITVTNPGFDTWNIPNGQRIEVVVFNSWFARTEVLKTVLSQFDPKFAPLVGNGLNKTWGSLKATRVDKVDLYVLEHPYSISYNDLDQVMRSQAPMVKLYRNGAVVEANQQSTQYAILELGRDFGNNGDSPDRLTANIYNAQWKYAWPIASYVYLLMRKTTLRPNATCDHVRETMQFWYWFWYSPVAQNIVVSKGLAVLPPQVRDVVVARFLQDIYCNGVQVWNMNSSAKVTASGVNWISNVFTRFATAYHLVEPMADVTYVTVPIEAESDIENQLDANTIVASWIPWTDRIHHSGYRFIFAGIGLVVISLYDVVLDVSLIARIFDGEITSWFHPDILKINPNGIRTPAGQQLNSSDANVVLFQSPTSADGMLRSLLSQAKPSYTGDTLETSQFFSTETLLRSAVVTTPGAIAVTPLTGDFDTGLVFAAIRRSSGAIVKPSWQSIQRCVDTPVGGNVVLSNSQDDGCYPLAGAVYFTLRKPTDCKDHGNARTAAVKFLEWLISQPALELSMQQDNIAPLIHEPVLAAANDAALLAITCNPLLHKTNYVVIIVPSCVCGAAFLLLYAAFLICYRQRGRNNTTAPKDASAPFCILFTDIQSSTCLWSSIPDLMAPALDAHHSIIRHLIKKHHLYEVKTIGDSFMIATSDPRKALDFALEVQQEFHRHTWGTPAIDMLYQHKMKEDYKCEPAQTSGEVWNGLRVRVGMHFGRGQIVVDPITGGYDYYGTVVNCAARVESVCHGGQIGVTHELWDCLEGQHPDSVWKDLGRHELRGLAQPIHLYQVLPAGPLSRRSFPRLRIEKAEHVDERDGNEGPDTNASSDYSHSTAMFFHPETHPLVINGTITALELQQTYAIAISTLSTLLTTQTAKFRTATLQGLCSRLHVQNMGNVGHKLHQTLHTLVLRILPAIVSTNDDRRMSRTQLSPSKSSAHTHHLDILSVEPIP